MFLWELQVVWVELWKVAEPVVYLQFQLSSFIARGRTGIFLMLKWRKRQNLKRKQAKFMETIIFF